MISIINDITNSLLHSINTFLVLWQLLTGSTSNFMMPRNGLVETVGLSL